MLDVAQYLQPSAASSLCMALSRDWLAKQRRVPPTRGMVPSMPLYLCFAGAQLAQLPGLCRCLLHYGDSDEMTGRGDIARTLCLRVADRHTTNGMRMGRKCCVSDWRKYWRHRAYLVRMFVAGDCGGISNLFVGVNSIR